MAAEPLPRPVTGATRYRSTSHPIRYGRFLELRHADLVMHFAPSGAIRYLSSLAPGWPHPSEWLKRSQGNHWIYYSSGDYYSGVADLLGEYYLPCPDYPTNSLFAEQPFASQAVQSALAGVDLLCRQLAARGVSEPQLAAIAAHDFASLARRADRLNRLLRARISVLPPDCRQVDYDVLPLVVADGCLYNCGFCEVKSGREFTERSLVDIRGQLAGLVKLLGPDLPNYNSLFLGLHDALAANPDLLLTAAEEAHEVLGFEQSVMVEPRLFLFGSVDSLLDCSDGFLDRLNRLPYRTSINIGLESCDPATLELIRKPIGRDRVVAAFARLREINRRCDMVSISANFLLGEELPASHFESLAELLADGSAGAAGKTTIYISPLRGAANRRQLLDQFRALKRRSRFETYLYLIQQL